MNGLLRMGNVAVAGKRSGALAGTLMVLLLSVLGGMYCQTRVWELNAEERYLSQHGREAGAEYAQTFERAAAERQLATFDQRVLLVEEIFQWKQWQVFFLALGVLSALGASVLHVLHRSRAQGSRPLFELSLPAMR